MTRPESKLFDAVGVFRCCLESLRDATLPKDVPVGFVQPCQWCREGMAWNGTVWIASWRFKAKDAK